MSSSILSPVVCMHRIVLVLLLAAAPAFSQAADARSEIVGKWKISSVLDLIDMTSRTEEEARRLIGQVLVIRNEGARMDDYTCASPDFATSKVKPSLYIREFAGIDARKLRLPDPVTVVDISCTQVFIKSRNRLVLFWDGWFFEAVRVAQ